MAWLLTKARKVVGGDPTIPPGTANGKQAIKPPVAAAATESMYSRQGKKLN